MSPQIFQRRNNIRGTIALAWGLATIVLGERPSIGDDKEPPAATSSFVSTSGAFRVELLSLRRRREIWLPRGGWILVDEDGRARPISARRAVHPDDTPLVARLRVTANPDSPFRLNGRVALVEVVDNQNQTLLPPERLLSRDATVDAASSGSRKQRNQPGVTRLSPFQVLEFDVPLALPEIPGTHVRRFEGTIPALVATTSKEPSATLRLDEARGKTFEVGGVEWCVERVARESTKSLAIMLHAGMKGREADLRTVAGRARVRDELADFAGRQVAVLDDQSRPLRIDANVVARRSGAAVLLRAAPDDDQGPPDRLAVSTIVRNVVVIRFEFHDIPMP